MSDEQEAHLSRILREVNLRLPLKYRKGAQEHGGYLVAKPNLIDDAIDEAIDQIVYLLTLKEQLRINRPRDDI